MDRKNPEYEKPKIVDYGDVEELTANATTGSKMDATFPSGTPASVEHPPFS
jgi:hypothetical protein